MYESNNKSQREQEAFVTNRNQAPHRKIIPTNRSEPWENHVVPQFAAVKSQLQISKTLRLVLSSIYIDVCSWEPGKHGHTAHSLFMELHLRCATFWTTKISKWLVKIFQDSQHAIH